METVGEEILSLEQVQERMLRYAEATKTTEGWLACGMGCGRTSSETRPFDTNEISLLGHENRLDAYFVVDSPANFERARRQIGRTAIFHIAFPLEPEKLFPNVDSAEAFNVTSLIIDDTCAFPLTTNHQAQIPLRGHSRGGEIVDYFYVMGRWDYEYPGSTVPELSDLEWVDASEEVVRQFDSRITRSLEHLRQLHPPRTVFDY